MGFSTFIENFDGRNSAQTTGAVFLFVALEQFYADDWPITRSPNTLAAWIFFTVVDVVCICIACVRGIMRRERKTIHVPTYAAERITLRLIPSTAIAWPGERNLFDAHVTPGLPY